MGVLVCLSLVSVPEAQNAFKLRCLTAGISLRGDDYPEALAKTREFFEMSVPLLVKEGFFLQGGRVSTNPFPVYTRGTTVDEAVHRVSQLTIFTERMNLGLSIGPAIQDNRYDEEMIEKVCVLIKGLPVSSSMVIASPESGIHYDTIRAAAQTIVILADLDPLLNFSFAAVANVPSETPFFPAAYHDRGHDSFSIGTESARLVMDVCATAANILQAKEKLTGRLDTEYKKVARLGQTIERETGWRFEGVDTSPAPLKEVSIGKALEYLIEAPFGSRGTLAACALITDVIRSVPVPKAGYCGLMLPVMEDSVLAARAAEGRFGLDELLSYSAVCGTGLDVVPLPGDTSVEEIEKILRDVAALSLKLQKPLSARLLPMKGYAAGDVIQLESEYLLPTRVFRVK
jgi:hypothetical protein